MVLESGTFPAYVFVECSVQLCDDAVDERLKSVHSVDGRI